MTDPDLQQARPKEASAGIDIWRIDLTDLNIDRHREILSPEEQQRADKLVFPKDRASFSRSRCALRLILAQRLNCQAREISFRYAAHGKPELAGPAAPQLSFNLSHNEDIALIAVTAVEGRRVGVDVNRIGGRTGATDWAPIAKRSFSPQEREMLLSLPPDKQEKAFYRTWTQKEAYTKARGDGFTYGFQTFTVVVDGGAGLLADEKHPEALNQWHFSLLDLTQDHYVAALCYDGAEAEVTPRAFRPDEALA